MKYQLNRTSKKKNRRRQPKKVRRSRKFAFDPDCWGKNKPLEQLWNDLSSYLSAVIVYKGQTPYEIVKLQSQPQSQPQSQTPSQIYDRLMAFDGDPQVIAILSAHPGIKNAYETLVYPKAKDKTVDYVITNHEKFFKRLPARMQATDMPIKKLMVPR
jgi:hypothetical protein